MGLLLPDARSFYLFTTRCCGNDCSASGIRCVLTNEIASLQDDGGGRIDGVRFSLSVRARTMHSDNPPAPLVDATGGTTAPPVPRKPRRRRRWIIAAACLLQVGALPVGGYFYLAWQQEQELNALLAELERTDPHWRFDELMADRPVVPDAENPALVVMKVQALLRPGGYDIGPNNSRLFDELHSPVARLNEPQIAALRESFTRHGAALKLARTLKDFNGEGRYPITPAPDYLSTNLDPLQRCRGVMWMLQNDAMLRAEAEDGAGAMESCRACIVVARSIGQEPYLVAGLIRFAGRAIALSALERALAQSEPPAAELAAMQGLVAREIEARVMVETLRGERAGEEILLRMHKDGKVKLTAFLTGGPPGPKSGITEWLLDRLPTRVAGGQPELLRLMTLNVETAKMPVEMQGPAFAAIEQEADSSSAAFVRLLMPAIAKVTLAHRRSQALMRCGLVGIAAERYRIAHGHWPAALADLCKDGLLPMAPADPFDGRPLRLKVLPDGVLIYSIGMDGVDNGGTINRENPMAPGTDLGFQLWDVRARRQAPMPVRAAND
jgi:hypothetical protein